MDSRERFTDTVQDYIRYRPDYPEALVDWALEGLEVRRIVDLGAGTGIASRRFARPGLDVVGVEPNDGMRQAASAAGGARFVKGDAAATGLPSACADLVICAQAWHWFGPEALDELRRILRAGGRGCVFWNERRDRPGTPMGEYERLLRAHCPDYQGNVTRFEPVLEALRARAGGERAAFDNHQLLDRAGLHGRAASASYVRHGLVDPKGFAAGLDRLFDTHQADGRVRLDYEVIALRFRA